MKQLNTNWTNDELKVYIMLFCINSNFKNVAEDINFSSRNIGKEKLNLIEKEFRKDNDYQSIQKICLALEKNNLTSNYLNLFFNEIEVMITSSGRKFTCLMNNIFLGFERTLLKSARLA